MDNRKLLGKITYKPVSAIAIVFVAGIAAAVLFRNVFGFVFGGFCILLSAASYVLVKDHPVIDVYQDELIIYDASRGFLPVRIPAAEVVQWEVNRNQSSAVTVMSKNRKPLSVVTYQTRKAVSLFRKAFPGKSTEEIVIQRNQNRKRKNKKGLFR